MKRVLLAAAMICTSSAAFAAWDFKLIEDPMTDAKRGISSVAAPDASGVLVVKCDNNGDDSLYVSIISKQYLGGSSGNRLREIKYRLDGGEIQSINGMYDGHSANLFGLKAGTSERKFVEQLMASKKAVIQVTSYDFDTYTILLDTTGARDAVQKSARACGDSTWLASPIGAPTQ